METTRRKLMARHRTPQRLTHGSQPRAFTLVELLVVITIIGILVALITAAAAGALKRGRQAQIKTELDQIAMAIETYKNDKGSYPPNCQVDGLSGANNPIDESQVLIDLKRHFKQAFPRHRESDELIAALAGLRKDGTMLTGSEQLQGGMSAGEAIVFWLGGFSADPKYPISGEGGPSYAIPGSSPNRELDTLSRKWIFPFKVERLEPRLTDGYFDDSVSSGRRFIEYHDPQFPNDTSKMRRINFWQYVPAKSEVPYLYFDVSRHEPEIRFDPPAGTETSPNALDVHAVKKKHESSSATITIQFANQDKFQILHAGVDDAWGDFEPMSLAHIVPPEQVLVFPNGPFTGDVADTIVNFSDSTLEASQP